MTGRKPRRNRAGDSDNSRNDGHPSGAPPEGRQSIPTTQPDGTATQGAHPEVPPGVDLSEAFFGFVQFIQSAECTTALKNLNRGRKLIKKGI